jgi:DNA helicase-2/ATP-dependent DNA helicase PcrA
MLYSHHTKLNDDPPYLQNLNPPQRDSVLTVEGPVLVLAGAGTGKTRALTSRLAHILYNNYAFPSQILAVTFTNKSAHELKERVSKLLNGQPVEGWWLGTFHSLCAKMLRRHAPLVGLQSDFTILDSDDQLRLIKQILEELNIDPKKSPPKMVQSIIERWKDRARLPSAISSHDAGDAAEGKMVQIYTLYQTRLKNLNACDFGDLLLHMITIFNDTSNGVLADYHRRFKYIMVDEYQDTNVAQYLWLRLLAQQSHNICCVGDDDQSIYGWRGAEVGNILRFEKDFPNAKIIRLEQNYRSTNHILKAASAVIANNEGRLGKTLWSDEGEGEKIFTQALWDGEAEGRFVAEQIETLRRQGEKYITMAVLVRTSFQMREFEDKFIQNGIPYRVFGGPRFYERAEVRDSLAYLRVIAQPNDDLALGRIINLPKRGIGDTSIQLFHETARAQNISMYVAIQKLIDQKNLKPKLHQTISEFIAQCEGWRSLISSTPPSELAQKILEESGYIAMWQNDKTPEAAGRVENIKEFISSVGEFETLTEFLEHVALVLELQSNNDNQDYVSIMTLHGAKGLEFNNVFLPGWEEGLFPSQRSMDENGMAGLEEERRLAYVGITRARRKAFISYVGNRRLYGSWVNALPSRFIDELPKESITANAVQGLYEPTKQRSGFYDGNLSSPSPSPVRKISSNHLADHEDGFNIGARVHHESFGLGKVINRAGRKLDILFFSDGATRRIMDNFVTLADENDQS